MKKQFVALSCFLFAFAFGLSQASAAPAAVTVTDTVCGLVLPNKRLGAVKCNSKQVTTNSKQGNLILTIRGQLLKGTKAPKKTQQWSNANTGYICNAGWSGKKYGPTKKWKQTTNTNGKILLRCHYKLPKKKK